MTSTRTLEDAGDSLASNPCGGFVDNRQAACRRPLTLLVEWAGLVAETPGLAWDKSNGIERCGTDLTR